MESGYRLKEHLGLFKVEKLVEEMDIKQTRLSRILPKFFKPIIVKKKEWKTLNSIGGTHCFITPPIRFKTREEAIKFIKNLEVKYHNIESKEITNG